MILQNHMGKFTIEVGVDDVETNSHPQVLITPTILTSIVNSVDCTGNQTPVRVHSELYSSDAFTQANRDLRDSFRQPGCLLPKDHCRPHGQLTAFNDVMPWSLYLAIGNEPKYNNSNDMAT
jgi:hypothetical protein